jgi:hypothetical protein
VEEVVVEVGKRKKRLKRLREGEEERDRMLPFLSLACPLQPTYRTSSSQARHGCETLST